MSRNHISFRADFKGLSRLWPFLRPDRKYLFITIALIPVLSAAQAWQPLLIKEAIDEGILKGNQDVLLRASLLFGFLVFVRYLCRVTSTMVSAVAIYQTIVRLRRKLVAHILGQNSSFHDRTMSGVLATRCTTDFDNLSESMTTGVISILLDLCVLVGTILGMLMLSWELTIAVIIFLPPMFFCTTWFSRKLKERLLRSRKDLAKLNSFTQESIGASKTVKILTAESEAQRRFLTLNRAFRTSQNKSTFYDAALFSLLEGASTVAIGVVLYLSLNGSYPEMTAGILIAFVRLTQQLFEPVKQLGSTMTMFQGVFTSMDRIFGLLENNYRVVGNEKITLKGGAVVFENVNFSYSKAQRILHDVSFSISNGESLAIIGSTGSGKSTIIKTLCKMYDIDSGKILVDLQDIRSMEPTNYRSQIAIVPQDIVLFQGSVLFNITLGDTTIDHETAIAAAEKLGVGDFVRNYDRGYEEEIKENGLNLSVGQKQLIVFARALCRNPKLIILDEATSSIDPESEEQIQRAMKTLTANRTVIIIAHRLSTIKDCDKILVLDAGQVKESGTHDYLIQLNGRYHEFINGKSKQMSETK